MSTTAVQDHPLPPPEARVPQDWAARINEAKKAREMGRCLRRGKPVTFTNRRTERRAAR